MDGSREFSEKAFYMCLARCQQNLNKMGESIDINLKMGKKCEV